MINTNDEYGGPGKSPSGQRARNFAVASAQTRCVSSELGEKIRETFKNLYFQGLFLANGQLF
jgi:hypothetical protein